MLGKVNEVVIFSAEGQSATCLGDGGGPLTVDGIQVGVVSFGIEDCEAGSPDVFVRLTEYTDWLKEHSDIEF